MMCRATDIRYSTPHFFDDPHDVLSYNRSRIKEHASVTHVQVTAADTICCKPYDRIERRFEFPFRMVADFHLLYTLTEHRLRKINTPGSV
jgi:hypothetical protein